MGARPLRRILLADDQREIRSIAGLALGKIGRFELRACESGEAALAEAPGFAPDLLLLDMNMPGMDGVQTLHALRAAGIAAPAIFFTSRAAGDDVARYRDAGAAGTIPKPFDPLKLGGQILRIWESLPPQDTP